MKPNTYRLTVQPYFKSDTMPSNYTGFVEIDFTCVTETSKLVLHTNKLDLNLDQIKIVSAADKDFSNTPTLVTSHDPVTHFFTVTFPKGELFKANQNYTFSVSYMGYTVDDNLGFYRSKYEDSGEK